MVDEAERLLQGPVPDGGWTDLEIATLERRARRLQKEGLNEMDAEKLAQTMLYRDRPDSGDDRRLCLECKRFRSNKCGIRLPMLTTVLQRCAGFSMKG